MDDWYGEGPREVEVATDTAVWYHAGKPPVAIRWVLIRDPHKRFKPQALLSTNLAHTSEQMLTWFESREILGIMDHLRYNGLCHSSATRTRRSSRMRVKLQLVLCSDEGHEETVTNVITLDKDHRRIERLGLTLAEAKQLLSTLQRHLLQHQMKAPRSLLRGAFILQILTSGGFR